jgi:hypothetical protein
MKEGTVPVPPYHPCAKRDDDVVPFQGPEAGVLRIKYIFMIRV